MASRLRELLDEQKVPHTGNVKRWARDIDVLLRKPNVDQDEAKTILEWSQTPDCWHVVRSGESFKGKYGDMLVAWRKQQRRKAPEPQNQFQDLRSVE